MQREDTVPWYRQFWPWFVMALPASAVVAGLSTVWIAMQTTDSLVIQSDVGMEQVTERNTAAEQEARRLGISALLDLNPETGAASVSITSAGADELPTTLDLKLRHPTMASRDASIELVRALPNAEGQATWVGHFLRPPTGRYVLTLSSEDSWRLTSTWNGQSRFRLEPAGQSDHGQP